MAEATPRTRSRRAASSSPAPEAPSRTDVAPTPGEPERATGGLSIPPSAWAWFRTACIMISIFFGYQLVLVVGGAVEALLRVFLYVLFGAVVGFIAGPAVDRLERYARIPRGVAIAVVLLSGLGAIALLITLLAGAGASEASRLSAQLPDFLQRAQGKLSAVSGFLQSHGINVPHGGDLLAGQEGQISSGAGRYAFKGITYTLNLVLDVVVTLVVAFWLIKDGESLREGLNRLVPSRVRSQLDFALDAVGVVVGGYVRAQLFMAFLLGSMAGIGCWALGRFMGVPGGFPFPILVAVFAGVFELIPLVGAFVGGAVAILLALTVSIRLAFFTLLLFVALHIIEGYGLAPRIQEKFVRLHPLIALLALFAGTEVGGFLGALFAIPACSLLSVFIRAAVGDWRASRPDLFASREEDSYLEGRRRRLLREFRLFKRSPLQSLRERFGSR